MTDDLCHEPPDSAERAKAAALRHSFRGKEIADMTRDELLVVIGHLLGHADYLRAQHDQDLASMVGRPRR